MQRYYLPIEGFKEKELEEEILILKNEDKTCSQRYIELTKDFHTIF